MYVKESSECLIEHWKNEIWNEEQQKKNELFFKKKGSNLDFSENHEY